MAILVRLGQHLLHVGDGIDGLLVHLQDDVAAANAGRRGGAAGLHAGHQDAIGERKVVIAAGVGLPVAQIEAEVAAAGFRPIGRLGRFGVHLADGHREVKRLALTLHGDGHVLVDRGFRQPCPAGLARWQQACRQTP